MNHPDREDMVTQRDLDQARQAGHEYAAEMNSDLNEARVKAGIEFMYRYLTRDDYRPNPDE